MQMAMACVVFAAYHFPEPLSMAFATVPYDPLPKIAQFLRPEDCTVVWIAVETEDLR